MRARLANETQNIMHKSSCSASGSDRIHHGQDSEEDVALIEAVGSSLAIRGSARDLLPPRSVTRQKVNNHPGRKLEEESLVTNGPTSAPLDRQSAEIPPTAVPNPRARRPPRSKRPRWCPSTFVQVTVLAVVLGTVALIAKTYLSLDSPTFDLTDRDVDQDLNRTDLNDTDYPSAADSINQTRLGETGVSVVRKAEGKIGSRSSLHSSTAERVQSGFTDGRLENSSAPSNDHATFVVKLKAASGPVLPVLSLLAAKSKPQDDQPSRPDWLEPDNNWTPHPVNGT